MFQRQTGVIGAGKIPEMDECGKLVFEEVEEEAGETKGKKRPP
jgi:hypothetical protein